MYIYLNILLIVLLFQFMGCITYKSNFIIEKYDNKAKITFDCGDIYEGEIKLDDIHGKGTYEWEEHPEFLRFEGIFYNGLPYEGILTTVSGRRFEVNLNGKFILKGKVMEIFPNNSKKQTEL